MRARRVYAIQRPGFIDRQTGEWRDKYDLSAAEEHGRLVFLLGNTKGNIDEGAIPEVLARMHHRLSDYEDGDSLLLVGDPVVIGFAAAIAAHYNSGRISLLKWDRIERRYNTFQANLFKE